MWKPLPYGAYKYGNLCVSEELNSVETRDDAHGKNTGPGFQKNLIVWKPWTVVIDKEGPYTVSEELNSVETSHKCLPKFGFPIVSEELNSVETEKEEKEMEMITEFQKNLIVWKLQASEETDESRGQCFRRT